MMVLMIRFLCTFLLFQHAASLQIETCPISTPLRTYLFQFRNLMLQTDSFYNETGTICDPSQSPNLTDIFQSVLILTDSQSQLSFANELLPRIIGRCRIGAAVLEVAKNESVVLDQMCSPSRASLILDLAGELGKTYTMQACTVETNNQDDPFTRIVASCQSSIWASGLVALNGSDAMMVNVSVISKASRNNHLLVGTLPYAPFVERTEVNGTTIYSGMVFELVDRLASEMGFTYEIVEPRDQAYGMDSGGNGTWDGGIGMLMNGEIDMFAGAITVTYDRSLVVDFAVPFHFDYVALTLKKPPSSLSLLQWAKPLSGKVWAAVICSIFLGSLYIWILHVKAALPTDTGLEKWGNCFWYLMSGLMNQGSELHPTTLSAMLFLGFWWLYCVAMIAVYSGVLVAMLTTNRETMPINDFNDLSDAVDSGSYKLCMVRSTNIHAAINDAVSGDKAFVRLRSWLNAHPKYVVDTDEECFQMLLSEETIALVGEATALESLQKELCRNASLIVVNDRVHPSFLSLAFPKRSPLAHLATERITHIYETGLLDAWRKNYSSKSMCQADDGDQILGVRADTEVLTLDEIGGLFLFVGCGIVVSTVIVLAESLFGSRRWAMLTGRPAPMQDRPKEVYQEPEWSGRISPIYKRRFGEKAFYMYL